MINYVKKRVKWYKNCSFEKRSPSSKSKYVERPIVKKVPWGKDEKKESEIESEIGYLWSNYLKTDSVPFA